MTAGLRLVVSGGGTAGHVYPALALLDAWGLPAPEVHWVGSVGGMEGDIVAGRGIPFTAVQAAAIRDRTPLQTGSNLVRLGAGYAQAVRALRRLRPQVVLTTGGYVTVPVAYAAATLRIPLVVFLPDVRAGLAVRAQARLADVLALAFPDAAGGLAGRPVVITGYPLRPALLAADRVVARHRLGLSDDLPVVLLYGGSRGARTLNEGLVARLEDVLAHCQLLHVGGTADEERLRRRAATLPADLAARYHLFGFIGDQLVDALVAADLAVARSGAATLAELPAVGLPAIVVPGPFSDQDVNAAWLGERGAAMVLTNDDVQRGALPDAILGLLADPARRATMSIAASGLGRRDAAAALRELVYTTAAQSPTS